MFFYQIASWVSLLCAILTIGNAIQKDATKFNRVWFSIMTVVFIILCVMLQIGTA